MPLHPPVLKHHPPSRGDLSGRSSGVCNARAFPESKSRRGIRQFVSAYYPRHTPQSPPSRGGARSAGGCIFSGRYRHTSLSLNRKIKDHLATMTTSGVTSSYTYDPWGRLASRSATISGQSYTATYTYRFGDKLQRIDSNFPGETPVVLYNYSSSLPNSIWPCICPRSSTSHPCEKACIHRYYPQANGNRISRESAFQNGILERV